MSSTSFPLCSSGGGSSLSLVSTTLISTPTSNIDINNTITGFDSYLVRYKARLSRPGVGTGYLAMRFGNAGVFLTSNYFSQSSTGNFSDAIILGQTSGGSLNTLDTWVYGEANILSFNDANTGVGVARYFYFENVSPGTTVNYVSDTWNRNYLTTRQANNSIQFICTAGAVTPTIEEGTFKIYGYNL